MEVVRIVGRVKVETGVEVVRGVAEVLTEGEVVRMAEGVVGPREMVAMVAMVAMVVMVAMVAMVASLNSHPVPLIVVRLTGSLIVNAP